MAERIFSERGRRRRLTGQFDRLTSDLEQDASRATRAGIDRSLAFDPTQAVTRFGQGFLDEAKEGLGQEFDSLVGGSVGAGRLRTGFFQRDAGRLFQDFNRRVSNAIAMQSLEASRQSLVNIQNLNQTGGLIRSQQIDVLGGALDRATAEENANQGGGFGGFLKSAAGAALGVAGGAFLGPLGAAAGSALAGRLGLTPGAGAAPSFAGGPPTGSQGFSGRQLNFGRPSFSAGR